MLHRPPDSAVRAFGADPDQLLRLPGGQGTSWRAGDLVLKPGEAPLQRWLSSTLRELEPAGLRMAVPVAAADGAWSVAGWTATSFVDGQEPDLRRPTSWPKIVAAGRLFHHALASTPRPALLDSRTDPWAVADRVAWGEQHAQFHPAFDEVAGRLRAQPAPPGPAQLVHGDLTGNVLLAPGLAPAVIDVSPYWRPATWAEAVVVADALCYHGADAAALPAAGVAVPDVARALLFRLATTNAFLAAGRTNFDVTAEARRFTCAAATIGIS